MKALKINISTKSAAKGDQRVFSLLSHLIMKRHYQEAGGVNQGEVTSAVANMSLDFVDIGKKNKKCLVT